MYFTFKGSLLVCLIWEGYTCFIKFFPTNILHHPNSKDPQTSTDLFILEYIITANHLSWYQFNFSYILNRVFKNGAPVLNNNQYLIQYRHYHTSYITFMKLWSYCRQCLLLHIVLIPVSVPANASPLMIKSTERKKQTHSPADVSFLRQAGECSCYYSEVFSISASRIQKGSTQQEVLGIYIRTTKGTARQSLISGT